jgi:hypothetical protein
MRVCETRKHVCLQHQFRIPTVAEGGNSIPQECAPKLPFAMLHEVANALRLPQSLHSGNFPFINFWGGMQRDAQVFQKMIVLVEDWARALPYTVFTQALQTALAAGVQLPYRNEADKAPKYDLQAYDRMRIQQADTVSLRQRYAMSQGQQAQGQYDAIGQSPAGAPLVRPTCCMLVVCFVLCCAHSALQSCASVLAHVQCLICVVLCCAVNKCCSVLAHVQCLFCAVLCACSVFILRCAVLCCAVNKCCSWIVKFPAHNKKRR